MQPSETLADPPVPTEKLTAADRRLMALAAAVILFSASFLWYNYRAAFPQASLDLKLGRDDITANAKAFLETRGWHTAGFYNLTLFEPDDQARLFLERELGLEQANAMMRRGDVPVWQWRARWYKPPGREEFRVWLTPDGRVAGFDHVLSEDAPGQSLTADQARALAEAFLERQPTGKSHLVEQESEKRPHRVDHVFTYQLDAFDAHGATIRRSVSVRGGEVAAYSEFLKIPEQWQRDFAAMRSKNQLYGQAAQALYMVLIAAALVLLIQTLRRSAADWRPLFVICAVVGGLMVIAQWNLLPFLLDARSTSLPVYESVALAILEGLGAGVGVFIYVVLAAVPGETAYRRQWPDKLRLGAAFTPAGMRTREFFRGCVSGYAMAAGHLVFVTAFYLLGQRAGVWAPQDVDYSNLLSTALPWIYPLTISAQAASAEEFWFRLLAIPLLLQLTRRWRGSIVISIVVPALVWGFLHSSYPQQPAWIRGVEVGAIGIVAGMVLLRFGIVATLVWHYTVDAVLIGSYLLQSSSAYFRMSGVLVAGVVLLPLAIASVAYRRRGGFVRGDDLANAAKPIPALPAHPAAPVLVPPWTPPWPVWRLHAAAAVVTLGATLVTVRPYGDFVRVTLTRGQAIAAAGPALPEERVVASFEENLDDAVFEYLRRQVGPAECRQLVERYTATGIWRVRFFRPGKKEERWVFVDRQGRPYRTDWILEETSPGADLAKSDALAAAQAYLRAAGLDLDRYSLLDYSSEKREHRTDHFFVWEHASVHPGEARARVSLRILGERPSEYRRYLFIPEAFLRDFRRPRLSGYLLPSLAGGLAVLVVLGFFRNLRRARVQWRICFWWAAAGLAAFLVTSLNNIPSFYLSYDTSQPLTDYTGDRLLSLGMWGILSGLLFFLGALAVQVVVPLAHGERRLPAPSLPLSAAFAALIAGLPRLFAAAEALLPGDRKSLTVWQAPGVENWMPAVGALASGFAGAFAAAAIAAVAIAAVIHSYQPRARVYLALAAAVAVALSRGSNLPQYLFHAGAALVFLAGVSLAVRTSGAAVLSLGLALAALSWMRQGWELAEQAPGPLRLQVWAAGGVALLLAGAWVFAVRRSTAFESPGGSG
ncbi:MAG: CPBP family intramembrane glutamic endopeptidase [Bryobacteraceae bacterium]